MSVRVSRSAPRLPCSRRQEPHRFRASCAHRSGRACRAAPPETLFDRISFACRRRDFSDCSSSLHNRKHGDLVPEMDSEPQSARSVIEHVGTIVLRATCQLHNYKKGQMLMIKKIALLAAAGLLYVAAPVSSASAQGISVRIGDGYHHRDHGWRNSHAYMRHDRGWHRGWDRGRGHRGRTVIIHR